MARIRALQKDALSEAPGSPGIIRSHLINGEGANWPDSCKRCERHFVALFEVGYFLKGRTEYQAGDL